MGGCTQKWSTYIHTRDRLDKLRSALAEAQLKIKKDLPDIPYIIQNAIKVHEVNSTTTYRCVIELYWSPNSCTSSPPSHARKVLLCCIKFQWENGSSFRHVQHSCACSTKIPKTLWTRSPIKVISRFLIKG